MGSWSQISRFQLVEIAIRSARQACKHTDSTPERERRSHAPEEEGFKEDHVPYCGTTPLSTSTKYHIMILLASFLLHCSFLYGGGSECLSTVDQLEHRFQRDGSFWNLRKAQEITDRETLVPWVEPEKFARGGL